MAPRNTSKVTRNELKAHPVRLVFAFVDIFFFFFLDCFIRVEGRFFTADRPKRFGFRRKINFYRSSLSLFYAAIFVLVAKRFGRAVSILEVHYRDNIFFFLDQMCKIFMQSCTSVSVSIVIFLVVKSKKYEPIDLVIDDRLLSICINFFFK